MLGDGGSTDSSAVATVSVNGLALKIVAAIAARPRKNCIFFSLENKRIQQNKRLFDFEYQQVNMKFLHFKIAILYLELDEEGGRVQARKGEKKSKVKTRD